MDSSTINDDMLCPFCQIQFDDNQHLPRILPECGHTICTECLEKQLQEYQQNPSREFVCIEDNQKIQLEMMSVNNFPKNQYLVRMIDKKLNSICRTENMMRGSQNISKISQSENNFNSADDSNTQILLQLDEQQPQVQTSQFTQLQPAQYEICQMHRKEKDVICITEKMQICSHCALFGTHKDHLIKSIHEIQKEQASKAQEHLNIFCQIDNILKTVNDGQMQQEIKDMIDQKQNRLIEQVNNSFQILHQFINEKENQLIIQLQSEFSQIEQKHSSLQFDCQLHSQIDYYNNIVNQLLIEFGNNFDNNTICYSLFSQASEDTRQLGLEIQQETQQWMEQILQNVKDELNQEIIINQDYQMMDDLVKIVRKCNERLKKDSLVNDLSMMQIGDQDCFEYQNKSNSQIQNQSNYHSMQMSYDHQQQSQQQFDNSFQQIGSPDHRQSDNSILVNTNNRSQQVQQQSNAKQKQQEKRQPSEKKSKNSVRKGGNKRTLILNFKVNPKYEPEINKLKNGTAEVIDLTQADLGDMGMQVLAESIGTNKKMKSLKLTKNKITDEGLAILLNHLQENETLMTVSLAGNQLSDRSIDNLLQFLNENPQTGLRNINLCGNNNINSKKHKEKLIQFLSYGVNVSAT